MAMKRQISFPVIAMVFSLGMFFLNLQFSAGQDASATLEAENAAAPEQLEPLKIELTVREVRLDVVVTDNRGRPVTDLKATDFEVFQNNAQQKILSSVYVENQSDIAAQPSASRKSDRNIPALSTGTLKKEDTRRTIIFILDETSMSLENIYHAKTSLRNFVEKQMMSGDLVAILTTGRGNSAIQMFLSDKNQLLSRINALRLTSAPPDPNPDDSHLYRIYDNQLFTLSYSIRALEDMPGRKILNVLTAATTLSVPPVRVMSASPLDRINFFDLYNDRFSRLAEDALRAGVVINFLNIDGLQGTSRIQGISADGSFTESDMYALDSLVDPSTNNAKPVNPYSGSGFDAANKRENLMGRIPSDRADVLQKEFMQDVYENAKDARNLINPLPARTGGVTIENSNFFLEGIGRDVDNLMKGYYLVTYEPPEGTFGSVDKEIYNKIKVNVKRRNTQVHTRDGFYTSIVREENAGAPAAHPLQNAIFSPFLYSDINVNIAAGYVRDAKAGYLVRSWIHLDPKDVTVIETEDGGALIDLETVCLTSDVSGNVHDFVHAQYTFKVEPEKKSENLAWIQKHGIRFAMLVPVKKPGSYYVRAAVHDAKSGKVGSAYQYMEIPDLDGKALALSNIFMITSEDDRNWLLSEATEGVFSPVFQADEALSPALGTYALGNRLQAMAMIYNADAKAVASADIELQPVLYKDGEEFIRIGPMPVSPAVAGNLEGIPISLTLTGGSDLPPGDFMLQLVVTDKKNGNRKEGSASQTLNFTIMEK